MYTDESWAAFTKALERAQANIDYTNINTTNLLNQLMTTLKQKYTYLWKAKEGLKLRLLMLHSTIRIQPALMPHWYSL